MKTIFPGFCKHLPARTLLGGFLVFLLVAGGGPAESATSDRVLSASATAGIQLDEVEPAEVVILALADLGLPAGADKVTPSGAVSDVLLKDGTLRFSTPGDTGVDQEAAFEIEGGGTVTTLHVLIRSQRPTAVEAHVELLDDGLPPPNPPELTVTGLGPNNTITSNTVTFKLQGIAQLDLKDDSDGLVVGANNAAVSLNKFWVFDAADSSFSISGTVLQQLLSALPNGDLDVGLNFVSKDGEFAVSYNLLAMKPGAKVSGQLQTPQGDAVTGLAGKKILLTGYNAQMRAVALVDANGAFSFEGVIPDTYELTLNDLENPGVVGASTAIYPDTTQADVTLVYALGTGNETLSRQAAPASPMQSSFVSGTVTQNGTAPSDRNIPAGSSTMRWKSTFRQPTQKSPRSTLASHPTATIRHSPATTY